MSVWRFSAVSGELPKNEDVVVVDYQDICWCVE